MKSKLVDNKSPKIFTSPLSVGRNDITIKLPKEVLKCLGMGGKSKEICWAVTNNVIQITGLSPVLEIPLLSMTKENFVKDN